MAKKRRLRAKNRMGVVVPYDIAADDVTLGNGNSVESEIQKIKRSVNTLLFSIGNYAFPSGRPNLAWEIIVHSITLNLTKVSSDCALTEIADGMALTIQLFADQNYSLGNVLVTMGAKNITSFVYDSATGIVSIPIVTGAIIITAAAITPYDAKIEYLQSTGTQLIDTGVKPTVDFKCEIKAEFTAQNPFNTLVGAVNSVGQSSESDHKWGIALALESHNYPYIQIGGDYAYVQLSPLALRTYVCTLNNNMQRIESGSSVGTKELIGTWPDITLGLFARHRTDGNSISGASAKVYYCKLWNGGTLVRHFVPVRVGQEGKMYDLVSGQLFSNIGTGDFLLGNDITE